MLRTNPSFSDRVWKRTASTLDDYTSKWAGLHEDACRATRERGEQSEAMLDLRMGCLQRARRHLEATVGVLENADPDVVARADHLVSALRPLSDCSDIEGLSSDVDPPEPADADAVSLAHRHLAEADAELEAGRYGRAEGRAVEAWLSEHGD